MAKEVTSSEAFRESSGVSSVSRFSVRKPTGDVPDSQKFRNAPAPQEPQLLLALPQTEMHEPCIKPTTGQAGWPSVRVGQVPEPPELRTASELPEPKPLQASQGESMEMSEFVRQFLGQVCAHLDETLVMSFEKLALQIFSRQDELLQTIQGMLQLPKRHDSGRFAMESTLATCSPPNRRGCMQEFFSLNANTPREEYQAAKGPDGGQPYPDPVSAKALDDSETPSVRRNPEEMYEPMPPRVVEPSLQDTRARGWSTEARALASRERANSDVLAGVWSDQPASSADVGPRQYEPDDIERMSPSTDASQADDTIFQAQPVEPCSRTKSQREITPLSTIIGKTRGMQLEMESDSAVECLVSQAQALQNLRVALLCEEAGQQRQQQISALAPDPPQEERPTLFSLGSGRFRDMVNRPAFDNETQSVWSQRSAIRSSVGSVLSKFSGACREKLDVYTLDSLITDSLVDAERRSFAARFTAGGTAQEDNANDAHNLNNGYSSNENPAFDDVDATLDEAAEKGADTKTDSVNEAGTQERVSEGMCRPVAKRSATVKVTKGFNEARQTQENMILQNFTNSEETNPPATVMLDTSTERGCLAWLPDLPRCVLILFGIISLKKSRVWMRHGLLVMACTCLTFTFSVFQMMNQSNFFIGSIDACYSLGGFIGLYSLRQQRIGELLGPQSNILEKYARSSGFFKTWQQSSFPNFLIVTGLWFWVAFWAFWWTGVWSGVQVKTLGAAAAFIFVSGVLSALSLCQLHVCACMELMVDSFCAQFLERSDFGEGVVKWNILQALLRRTAYSIDFCFLVVNTSVLTVPLLTGLNYMLNASDQTLALRSLVSTIPMVFFMLYCQYRAAAVTEKCSRVPALVNSLVVDKAAMDCKRQYMVQFIVQSAAGFYMKGVRLTAFMVLKFAYLAMMLTMGLATRIVDDTR